MKPSSEKVFHCGTGIDSGRSAESSLKTSIHSSHSDESATFGILLTNIFLAPDRAKAEWSGNFRMQSGKMFIPSAHGAAAILPESLKYSTESNYLSVYGGSARGLVRLPVVREVRAIHQMLTAYCRITQSGPKETSTTITNTDDRYAQSLGYDWPALWGTNN
jgi:hypothetical protein